MADPERSVIAIFDLDRTLTRKGTWGRFVTGAIKGKPHKWLPFLFGTAWMQLRYRLGRCPRVDVKLAMLRHSVAGLPVDKLAARAERFAEREVPDGLRAQALGKIAKHRTNGDRIIIASAAADFILHPIAARLGIDEIVCTRHAITEDGRLSRSLRSPNCYGVGKLDMVKAYLESSPKFDRNSHLITVYSDSSSDIPIMDWANHGVAVNPSAKLLRKAADKGYIVEDWNTPMS